MCHAILTFSLDSITLSLLFLLSSPLLFIPLVMTQIQEQIKVLESENIEFCMRSIIEIWSSHRFINIYPYIYICIYRSSLFFEFLWFPMAGMLPGVECARRRRFHQSGGWSDSPGTAGHGCTRRSSFCLYASSHESHLSSSSLVLFLSFVHSFVLFSFFSLNKFFETTRP